VFFWFCEKPFMVSRRLTQMNADRICVHLRQSAAKNLSIS
jgi:hypothetical protein